MYNDDTPIGGQTSSSPAALIYAISKMPAEWALTPCIGKRNLWPQWNREPLDLAQLIEAIQLQKNHEGKKTLWTGVSIVTGPLSGGIMAIDFDGPLALTKYFELSGGQPPLSTKRWTSGRPGHFQILLQVPPEKWEGLQPITIKLENGEKLELRWNQCSTLPPSIHPDTGKPYYWKNDGEIAECPDFILDLMREQSPAVGWENPPRVQTTQYIDVEKSLVEILEQEILPRLDAEEFYGNYLKLKTSGKNLKGLCPFHQEKTPSFSVTPSEKTFHCFGCDAGGGPVQFLYQIKGGSGSPTGKDFYSVVMELADRVGMKMPDRKFTQNSESKIQKTNNVLQHSTTNNVVPLRPVQNPPISGLEEEIEALLESDLKKSQIQLKISELSQRFRIPSADVWKVYREQEQEQEQEADLPDVAVEIEALLAAHKSSIALTEVLPVELAQPIEKLAAMLNLRSECYLAALLTQVASLFKVGTETILRRDTDWRCVPNYFAGIVAEVSQLKTPIPKAIIDRPMRALRERAQKEFEQAQLNYETELNNWKAAKKEDDRGPTPKPPRQRIYSFDKTTGEGIIYQQAEFPDQAMMYFCDELAGMLKSGNQYRGGKGSDEEDMLSFWNGTGTTVLRAPGVRASVEAVGLSIFGTIQPDVLAGLLKDCSDSNGKFARFDFVIQPLAVPNLPEDDSGRFDLTPMLSDLYQKIDALPAICFEFDREAKKYHRTFTLACHERRVFDEPKQGLRGALGKMPEKVGKLSTIIHTLNCVFSGQQVSNHIPQSAVEAAVKFVKFAADQVTTLYTEFSDRSALSPNLTKILLAAERQGGKITVREAQDILRVKQQRPTAQTVREWFSELQEMKHGEVTTVRKSTFFTLATAARAAVNQNPVPERVKVSHNNLKPCAADAAVNETTAAYCDTTAASHMPQLESLPSKALNTIAASAAHISPPSEKSESLLLSYLTEPEEFAEQIREAIAKGKPIFLVDGEQCADILWMLNCVATTSIGGMGKFSPANSMDLQGAQVVIVPDRDEPGMKDADKAAEYFPEAKWLYPFPEKNWEHLPKSDGLDIFDWIGQGSLSPSGIRAVIGEKKVFKAPAPSTAANVIRPAQFQVPPISELEGEIEALLNSDLKKSQLQIRISELAHKFRVNSADVWKIYREREQELEQEASQDDTRIGIDQLLASQSASVKLSDIFPESLAVPIEIVATRMNLKPECYALALISGVSRFLKNGSSTMLVEEWNRYRCRTHGYFGAMIAEASQMKTPVLNAMIADPLAAMRENNQKKFEAQKKAYEAELENWKISKDEDKGPAPDAPVEKFAYITKATWEGIAGMVGRAPTQGILWLCDELAGFFNSANQYRSGRGSDKEDLLECWSGNGAVIARAAGTTVNVGAVSLSIYGNIQPKVLAPFLGDGSDDNGTFARFDFVQQPPALTQITLGLSKIDINPMLQALYERVDAISITEFALDEEARKLFVDYYNHCQRLRLNHPKQGMRAMLGKAAEKVGRVATILHCIHTAHLGGEVSPKIPASRVRAAIKWVEYTTQQALSINIEVCSPDALESNLAKIISLAERKGGTVTVRDVQASFDSKYRPTSQKIQEWLRGLTELKYGEVTEKGNSIRFSLTKTSTTSTVAEDADLVSFSTVEDYTSTTSTTSTPTVEKTTVLESTVEDCGGTVEVNRHTFKPLSDIALNASVEVVEVFTNPAETPPPSMLSRTTEPEEFAEQIRKAITNCDQALAIQVWDGLKAKVKRKLREEVKSHLTARESENFKILVTVGFLLDMRVKYVGDPQYAEQYEGLELEVYSMDEYCQITCRKPDGYLTTRMKPEELRKL